MTTTSFITVEDDTPHDLDIFMAAERLVISRQATTIAIIGGGLGGLSAAIALASEGFHVELFEKNDSLGGKVNVLRTNGFIFDLGPCTLTTPDVFNRLFTRVGKQLSDYVQLEPAEGQRRHFFADGTVLDLSHDAAFNQQQLQQLSHSAASELSHFLHFSNTLHAQIAPKGASSGFDQVKNYGAVKNLKRISQQDAMQFGLRLFVHNSKLFRILNSAVRYAHTQPFDAQAQMSPLSSTPQWKIKDGIYGIINAMKRLALELGVKVHLNSEVTEIISQHSRISGLRLKNGRQLSFDIVVSNMEWQPTLEQLLHVPPTQVKKDLPDHITGSAITLHLGLNCRYPQLLAHNFFYPKKKSLQRLAAPVAQLVTDPTLYVHASSLSNPSQTPTGCESISVMLHLPYIDPKQPLTPSDYLQLRQFIIDQLELLGLTDLHQHIVVEHCWTPHDFQRTYHATQGAIYGTTPGQKTANPANRLHFDNLYFVGGTSPLGGGMPMAVLSGLQIRDTILVDLGQRSAA